MIKMTPEELKEHSERLSAIVAQVITIFQKNSVSVQEATEVLFSIIATGLMTNTISDEYHQGLIYMCEEFTEYLRTGTSERLHIDHHYEHGIN